MDPSDDEAFIAKLPPVTPRICRSNPLQIVPLESYFHKNITPKVPGDDYLVPSFAMHYGLLTDGYLIHLQYCGSEHKVIFGGSRWPLLDLKNVKAGHEIRQVGATLWSSNEVCTISKPRTFNYTEILSEYFSQCFWRLSRFVLE
jgi:hypothetical protein